MEGIRYYAIEKRVTSDDGRMNEYETIVCEGSEIDCHYRIKEIKTLQEKNQESAGDTVEPGASGIQLEPVYYVTDADEYDEAHSLNQQRSMMNRFMTEFGLK